jgi:hypothetical protein
MMTQINKQSIKENNEKGGEDRVAVVSLGFRMPAF